MVLLNGALWFSSELPIELSLEDGSTYSLSGEQRLIGCL
jgi:hypothetical protein